MVLWFQVNGLGLVSRWFSRARAGGRAVQPPPDVVDVHQAHATQRGSHRGEGGAVGADQVVAVAEREHVQQGAQLRAWVVRERGQGGGGRAVVVGDQESG